MVKARGVTSGPALVIRPRPSLIRSGTLAITVGAVPLFGVLYWLSISQGSWRRVLAVNVVFVAVWVFAWIRVRRVHVTVDGESIIEQYLLKRTVVAKADVASIFIGSTYRDSSAETIPQFVARDASGTRLVRLRGYFWAIEDMMTLASAIGIRPQVDDTPFSRPEFYEANPGVAYWYEGRPWLKAGFIVIGFVAVAALIGWLMTAVGPPAG